MSLIKSSRSDGTFTMIASPSQDISPEVVASAISPSGKLTAIAEALRDKLGGR
jgi:hypothetical protein